MTDAHGQPTQIVGSQIAIGGLFAACAAVFCWACSDAAMPGLWASAVLSGCLGLAIVYAVDRLLRSTTAIRIYLIAYLCAAAVGSFVAWDNWQATRLYYSTSYDDSFYYMNVVDIIKHGHSYASGWTLFEAALAEYW